VTAPFDFAFVGAGVSSLLLLRELARARPGARVLVVEPSPASPHHTYAFWSEGESPLDALVEKRFSALDVVRPARQNARSDDDSEGKNGGWHRSVLERHSLCVFHLGMLQRAAVQASAALDVTTVKDTAVAVTSSEAGACVDVGETVYEARIVFDARPPMLRVLDDARTTLVQSFHGMTARLTGTTLDPQAALFMDFRVQEDGDGLLFGYALPLHGDVAFIETVRLSSSGRPPPDPDRYALEVLGASRVEPLHVEAGATFLSDAHFVRQTSPRVLAIGMRGGLLKSSTGYGVTRMQHDAERIVRSLDAHGHPFALEEPAPVVHFLDSVMIEVMARAPDAIPDALFALFRENAGDVVLRFLDERATPIEVARVIASLPKGAFVDVLAARARDFIAGI
jgi:lycopene beta-cyclase